MTETFYKKLESTYGLVNFHREIGELITRYSTNKQNIYQLALEKIHFNYAANVLDLGCGYGRFISYLKGIIPPASTCTGIDCLEKNRNPFQEVTRSLQFKGNFICKSAEAIAEFSERTFDLILSGYSLYYFIDVLPHIARVMTQDGWFIAITHSQHSLIEFLKELQAALNLNDKLTTDHPALDSTPLTFSSENGEELLQEYFMEVERIDYYNRLQFPAEAIENALRVLDFKRLTILKKSFYRNLIAEDILKLRLSKWVKNRMMDDGHYSLNKDDAIFRCRIPKAAGETS